MKPISIGTISLGNQQRPGEISFRNLTEEEVGRMQALVHGQNWASVQGGRLIFRSTLVPLPDPIEDKEMLPFWRKPDKENTPVQEELFDPVRIDHEGYASISIQSLCGYYYTEERYKEEAHRLESYGFAEMRSKRSPDGKYWQIWYLPGLWAAKGDLKEVVDELEQRARSWEDPNGSRKRKECFEAALEFIRTHASFGSLDVSVQRFAMPTPD